MNEKFYKDGLKFECQRCGFCCGNSPGFVYLSERDLTVLCEYFKMSAKEFTEKYCRFVDYYYGEKVLALKEKSNYDCVLWANGCTAYKARPVQCSTYPFWNWIIENENSWQDCAKECPGINKGKTWSVREIEKNKTSYLRNVPLKKEEVQSLIFSQKNENKQN